jgi:hypothetical protein
MLASTFTEVTVPLLIVGASLASSLALVLVRRARRRPSLGHNPMEAPGCHETGARR